MLNSSLSKNLVVTQFNGGELTVSNNAMTTRQITIETPIGYKPIFAFGSSSNAKIKTEPYHFDNTSVYLNVLNLVNEQVTSYVYTTVFFALDL